MMVLQLAVWGAWAPKLFPYMGMLGFSPWQQSLVGSCWGIAAVVGVILNLAVWFALHALFGAVDERRALGLRLLVPRWETLDGAALALSIAAFVAAFRFRVGMLGLLLGCGVLGVARGLLLGP